MRPKDQLVVRSHQSSSKKTAHHDSPVNKVSSDFPDDEKSGRLVFRTSPEIHGNIARAAEQREMSINSWMQAVLSEAANEVLGIDSGIATVASAEIRHLIEDPDASEILFDQVVDFLEKDDARTIFRFVAALKKLLIGLDAVHPFLQGSTMETSADLIAAMNGDKPASVKLAACVIPLLEVGLAEPQFMSAVRKLMIGIKEVEKFLKDEKLVLEVISTVEVMLDN